MISSLSFLKDTTDENALKRFAVQFSDSPLRKDADARVAALDAAQAAKPLPTPADRIAWNQVKDSKDPDLFRRFIRQFPDSTLRADAEQQILWLSPVTPPAANVRTSQPSQNTTVADATSAVAVPRPVSPLAPIAVPPALATMCRPSSAYIGGRCLRR